MIQTDFRSIQTWLNTLAIQESECLKIKLEEALLDPLNLVQKAPQTYQEKSKKALFNKYSEEEAIQSVAQQLLQPIVQTIDDELRRKAFNFIQTDEVQSFIKNDAHPEMVSFRIENSELNKVRRTYIESVHLNFAEKLAPYVEQALKAQKSGCTIL